MRYSNTAIKELSAKYRSVLKKCALFNAVILMTTALALPAMAERSGGIDVEMAEGVEWTGGSGFANGGAEFTTSGKTTTIIDSYIHHNTSSNAGGALVNLGTMTITGGEVSNNTSGVGAALYNAGTAVVGGNFSNNEASSWGGGIYNAGDLTISDNTTFNNNKSGSVGGAITNTLGTSVLTLGANVTFTANESATDGGAIGNYRGATLVNGTTFVGNKAQTGTTDENAIGGGALSLGAESTTQIANAVFTGNTSGFNGGALGTRNALSADNTAAMLDVEDSTFTGNKAFGTVTSTFSYGTATGGHGGALDNHFYNSTNESGYAYVARSTFTGNEAIEGGAIYNNGDEDYKGNIAKLYVEDATFTNNVASGNGGAVYNAGTLVLSGTTAFSGNKANGILNDIHNTGTLNIAGNLTLDGGITGTGTVNFTDTTNLTARLKSSASILGTVTGLKNVTVTDLIVENGLSDGWYALTSAEEGKNFADLTVSNSLYTFATDDEHSGQIQLTKKSTDSIVEDLTKNGDATAQEAATISAIADTTADTPVLNAITELVQTNKVAEAAEAAKELAPTTSQAVMGISKDLVGMMTNVANTRMAAAAGRAGGDVFKGGSMWVQGLYNHTKQDATSASEGFKSNSKGIAFGIDGKLNDAVTVGLGYGYTRTNADAGNRDVDVDGNNVFAYAEYNPSAWYVNGVLNFGYGRYTEKKAPAGIMMKSKYDVYTYGANVMAGYTFDSGFIPEGGLRYLLVDQKSYNDGLEEIKTSNNDVLTAVLGAKYGYAVKTKDWTFKPSLRLAATYDVVSDGSKAVASITGGSSYQITGERLHRFGVETGVGVTSTWKDWDFTLSYDGGFRKDYQSHTGSLKAKYHF